MGIWFQSPQPLLTYERSHKVLPHKFKNMFYILQLVFNCIEINYIKNSKAPFLGWYVTIFGASCSKSAAEVVMREIRIKIKTAFSIASCQFIGSWCTLFCQSGLGLGTAPINCFWDSCNGRIFLEKYLRIHYSFINLPVCGEVVFAGLVASLVSRSQHITYYAHCDETGI